MYLFFGTISYSEAILRIFPTDIPCFINPDPKIEGPEYKQKLQGNTEVQVINTLLHSSQGDLFQYSDHICLKNTQFTKKYEILPIPALFDGSSWINSPTRVYIFSLHKFNRNSVSFLFKKGSK